MNDFVNFFKSIFMLNSNDTFKIGLSQFKPEQTLNKPKSKKIKQSKEIKLSDLMRRAS